MIWIRPKWLRGSSYWMLLVWDWSSVSKPLSLKHRSTFLPLQHAATLIFSMDWSLEQIRTDCSEQLTTPSVCQCVSALTHLSTHVQAVTCGGASPFQRNDTPMYLIGCASASLAYR